MAVYWQLDFFYTLHVKMWWYKNSDMKPSKTSLSSHCHPILNFSHARINWLKPESDHKWVFIRVCFWKNVKRTTTKRAVIWHNFLTKKKCSLLAFRNRCCGNNNEIWHIFSVSFHTNERGNFRALNKPAHLRNNLNEGNRAWIYLWHIKDHRYCSCAIKDNMRVSWVII